MKPTLLTIFFYFLILLPAKAQEKIKFDSKSTKQESSHFIRTVAIEDFSIQRLSGARVFLTWHTKGSDTNGFVLERKTGVNEPYTTVGSIDPKSATSEGIVDYTFTDHNSFNGVSFYRIRQKDSKGTTFYSLTREISGKSKE